MLSYEKCILLPSLNALKQKGCSITGCVSSGFFFFLFEKLQWMGMGSLVSFWFSGPPVQS